MVACELGGATSDVVGFSAVHGSGGAVVEVLGVYGVGWMIVGSSSDGEPTEGRLCRLVVAVASTASAED